MDMFDDFDRSEKRFFSAFKAVAISMAVAAVVIAGGIIWGIVAIVQAVSG